MMNIFDYLPGWSRKVRRLRRKWDRAREKTLRKKNPIRRMALEKLDAIENNLRIIEEQKLSRVDRARLSKQVEIEIEEVKALLKTKPEELKNIPTIQRRA